MGNYRQDWDGPDCRYVIGMIHDNDKQGRVACRSSAFDSGLVGVVRS
jgi:hypothetical protein